MLKHVLELYGWRPRVGIMFHDLAISYNQEVGVN
jgi:hypothetical protein